MPRPGPQIRGYMTYRRGRSPQERPFHRVTLPGDFSADLARSAALVRLRGKAHIAIASRPAAGRGASRSKGSRQRDPLRTRR